MKKRYLDRKKRIYTTGLLATFKLTCDKNLFHERYAMWVLPRYVHETLANALKRWMCVADRIAPIIFLVCKNGTRSHELLQYYPGVVNCLLKIMLPIKLQLNSTQQLFAIYKWPTRFVNSIGKVQLLSRLMLLTSMTKEL